MKREFTERIQFTWNVDACAVSVYQALSKEPGYEASADDDWCVCECVMIAIGIIVQSSGQIIREDPIRIPARPHAGFGPINLPTCGPAHGRAGPLPLQESGGRRVPS